MKPRRCCLSRLTNEVKTESANLIRRIKKEAEEEADQQAPRLLPLQLID